MILGEHFTVTEGKTIRDTVHGDIFLPNKFLKIIDTPEFQRLRRIRQLSIAYLVFPGAEHTRFAHSIGTYFVMQKLIDHFKPLLSSINIELDERDANLALCGALLHDIGHGPFSHAFENAIPNTDKHEIWTIKIITSADSNINRILKEQFDEDFPIDLANIIGKEKSIKENGIVINDFDKIDLFFILSSLVSSQLDADRIDYLLRDSMNTGVIFGNIDIERIISSLIITVHNGNYNVCIIDKFLSDIENYLLARYQMHKEVYLHDVKCEMEIIIKKILDRVYYFRKKNKGLGLDLPKPLYKLFNKESVTVKEYITLDDNMLLSLFSSWSHAEDPILQKLCSCIINRDKYNKINIFYNRHEDINEFNEELINLLRKYNYDIKDLNNLKKEYFFIESVASYKIYEKKKDKIRILKNDGTVKDICDVSNLISEELNGKKSIIFLNYDILKNIEGVNDVDQAIEDIKNLVKLYNSRNHIEIEKKYILKNKSIYGKVLELLKNCKEYEIETERRIKEQKDYYYDTDAKILFKSNKTLRFRTRDDLWQLTIKTPTRTSADEENVKNLDTQSERFEYEIAVESESKNDNKKYIIKYLPELSNEAEWDSLKHSLTIINKREKLNLYNKNVHFELVFDDVRYINPNGTESIDYQIEIELKSEYLHRINLKILTDYLEKNIAGLIPMHDSKYKRGLGLTK